MFLNFKTNYLFNIFLIFVLFTVACATSGKEVVVKAGKSVRPQTTIADLQWDVEVGRLMYEASLHEIKSRGRVIDPPGYGDLIRRLTTALNRLRPYARMSDIPLQIHLVEDSMVNAVCYPGGGIIFFSGIFDKEKGLLDSNDEDAIAVVVAHEMAHATLRHAYKQVNAAKRGQILGLLISSVAEAGLGGQWSKYFSTAYVASLGLYLLKYSREEEAQADLESLYTIINAGYKPEKAIEIWDKASGRGGEGLSILSTHPSSLSRAAALKKHLAYIRSDQNK